MAEPRGDEIPFVDVTIDTAQFSESARPVLEFIRPQWKEQDVVFKVRTRVGWGGVIHGRLRCLPHM